MGQETGDGMSHSERPAGETAKDPVGPDNAADLKVQASSDTTVPDPTHGNSLSPDEARKLQRQYEDQIPAQTAEPPNTEETTQEFGIEQEQDVFYQPPDSVKPVLSALPRVRVPKTENDVQEGDSHIPPGINADVYYSGSKRDAGVADEEPSEEQLSQLFHSPRHATSLLGQKGRWTPPSKRPFHSATATRQKSSNADEQSIKQLAADVAKDAQRIGNVGLHSDYTRVDSTDQLTDSLDTTSSEPTGLSDAGVKSAVFKIRASCRVRRPSSVYGIRSCQ